MAIAAAVPVQIGLCIGGVLALYRQDMSLSRQTALAKLIPDKAKAPVVGVSSQWPSRSEKARHTHSRHQLMYSQKGVIHVSTPTGSWILPPTRSIWISGGIPHALLVKRPVELITLWVDRDAPGAPHWTGCNVVSVSPLIRELFDHLFGAALGLSARLSLFASRAGSSRTTRSARAGAAGATRVERPKSRAGRRHAQSRSGGSKAARRVSGGGRRKSQDDRTPFRFRDSNVFRQMARAASNDHRAGAVGARG